MIKRQLSERQVRWYEVLARFQFTLVYKPGSLQIIADALSRREQDTLGEDDKESRNRVLLGPEFTQKWVERGGQGVVVATTSIQLLATQLSNATEGPEEPVVETPESLASSPFQDVELNGLWKLALKQDTLYESVLRAVKDGSRSLPSEIKMKIQLGDCGVDSKGLLRHRDKLWVPGAPVSLESEYNALDSEKLLADVLRTRLIQTIHDSSVNGHPGRDATAAILGRDFYWPLQSRHVRQFLRNCDQCGRNKVWREHKHGLLRSLPVPDRFFQEISMDFITDLPLSDNCRYLWVIKDRLSKWVILAGMPTMNAEECAVKFLECWVQYFRMPHAITSDRGTNWTSTF